MTWLNAVDESYRTEFRDLFATNFGRLEAEMRALRQRLEAQMHALETRMQADLRALETRVEARLDRFEARMLRWMLVFWAGTMGTVIALLKL